MARSRRPPGGGSALRVEVDLSQSQRVPGWLERVQREWLAEGAEILAQGVRDKMPGSSLDDEIKSRTHSPTVAGIYSASPAVRAIDLGAYMRSRRGPGTAVRFTVGGRVKFKRYPKGTRVAPRHVFKRGLRTRRRQLDELFALKFGQGTI